MERNHHKKGKKKGSELPRPGPNALSYKGPLKIKAEKNETMTMTTTLNFTGVIASTAGGIIDSSYSSDPSSYALSDWTNLVGLYHEFRTLGVRVEFWPHNRYSKSTTVTTPGICVVDHESAGTLGSYQTAMSHESAKKISWEDGWMMEGRMSGAEEAAWLSTAAPVPLFWIKFYADGLSVSTTYGRFFVYVAVEMRGRK